MNKPCCETWAKACTDGTDNEGYGPLINEDGQLGNSCLPMPNFCPWCGTALSEFAMRFL